ncbi:NAD(P)H-binding protein [Enterobacter sp. Bisph1]|uniref:NAD(P)H-binding protein n=1 Tax=Enterobacter sp. Bisph1 TaxID=1274399 RepID=UPI000907BD68|nr:NAD(P)H-binding protein [Enterobacter sp. Bisph1]
MKVLIAGATGSIGRLVVNTMLAQGYQARAIVRTPQKAALLPAPLNWWLSAAMLSTT